MPVSDQEITTLASTHDIITIGMRADAPNRTLYVNPTLPDWLPEIELANLKVGRAKLHLRFWREGINSRFAIVDKKNGKLSFPPPDTAARSLRIECDRGTFETSDLQ